MSEESGKSRWCSEEVNSMCEGLRQILGSCVFPTDTEKVYGSGCTPYQKGAFAKMGKSRFITCPPGSFLENDRFGKFCSPCHIDSVNAITIAAECVDCPVRRGRSQERICLDIEQTVAFQIILTTMVRSSLLVCLGCFDNTDLKSKSGYT